VVGLQLSEYLIRLGQWATEQKPFFLHVLDALIQAALVCLLHTFFDSELSSSERAAVAIDVDGFTISSTLPSVRKAPYRRGQYKVTDQQDLARALNVLGGFAWKLFL